MRIQTKDCLTEFAEDIVLLIEHPSKLQDILDRLNDGVGIFGKCNALQDWTGLKPNAVLASEQLG